MTLALTLAHLAFSGPSVDVADLRFKPGLNLIFGASNTGKSFAYKAIDYAMGASRPLPDIEQRRPYDRLWLGFTRGGVARTIARAIAGGGMQLYPGLVRAQSDTSSRLLAQRNDPNDQDNISQFLLNEIDLAGKQIATNAAGKKRPLSFRASPASVWSMKPQSRARSRQFCRVSMSAVRRSEAFSSFCLQELMTARSWKWRIGRPSGRQRRRRSRSGRQRDDRGHGSRANCRLSRCR